MLRSRLLVARMIHARLSLNSLQGELEGGTLGNSQARSKSSRPCMDFKLFGTILVASKKFELALASLLRKWGCQYPLTSSWSLQNCLLLVFFFHRKQRQPFLLVLIPEVGGMGVFNCGTAHVFDIWS